MKKIVSKLSAALLVGAMVFTTSCKKEIIVTANKTSVAIGEDVTFTCIEESADKGKVKATSVTWQFGDEAETNGRSTETSTGQALRLYNNNNALQVVHSYDAAGTYQVAAIFNKSKKPTKKNSKSTFGTVDITVNAVTSTLTVKDANAADVTAVMDQQELTLAVTNDKTNMAQSSITYGWYDNGVNFTNTSNMFTTRTATAGKHTYRVKTSQGNTSSWSNEINVTVSGETLSEGEMQAMIGGKWNISMSASGTGADYGTSFPATPCGAGPFTATVLTFSNTSSQVYLDSNGDSDWDVQALPSSQAGNLNGSGNFTFDVVNSTTINVTSPASWTGNAGVDGLYTCTFSASSMTLTRKVGGGSSTGCQGSAVYTDTFTITMSR